MEGLLKDPRGHFGLGVYGLSKEVNLGTLWRSAFNFGASHIFIIGGRYSHQCSDTPKSWKHIPLFIYTDLDDFLKHRAFASQLVAVELTPRARPLETFTHPDIAQYILGPENGSLPDGLLDKCQHILSIDTQSCLNVSVAGAVIAYDRVTKSKLR